MPTKKLINRATWILQKSLIEMLAGNALSITFKSNDLVVILISLLSKEAQKKRMVHTSGLIEK